MEGVGAAGGAGVRVGWSYFFSSRGRHTRLRRDWSSDVCSSDLGKSINSFNKSQTPENLENQTAPGISAGGRFSVPVRRHTAASGELLLGGGA